MFLLKFRIVCLYCVQKHVIVCPHYLQSLNHFLLFCSVLYTCCLHENSPGTNTILSYVIFQTGYDEIILPDELTSTIHQVVMIYKIHSENI